MKKIILLVILLGIAGLAKSQTDSIAYYFKEGGLSRYKFIDMTQANSDYVYENTYHRVDFNYLIQEDFNNLSWSASEFYDLFSEWEHMNVKNDTSELTRKVFNEHFGYFRNHKNQIPLLVFAGQYAQIKRDCFETSLMDTDASGNYIPLVNQSELFEKKDITLATFYDGKIGQPGPATIVLDSSCLLGNLAFTDVKVQITFNSVTYNINWGDSITFDFESSGVYNINVRVLTPNRERFITVKIKVGISCEDIGFSTFNIMSTVSWGYEDDYLCAYTSKTGRYDFKQRWWRKYWVPTYCKSEYARAKIFVKYGNGNNSKCINRPIIFVEGVDFGTKELPIGCRENKCGGLGLIDIYTGYENGVEGEETAIYEFLGGLPSIGTMTKTGKQLFDKLSDMGFDIFYIDFENGSTYMENNAMVVVELINFLNKNKCSNEDNIVIGASMGGQVARFALAYMESNNIKHCTREFISFDSPNNGASIPVGLQKTIAWFADNNSKLFDIFSDAVDARDRKLLRPAAKQLLIAHYNNNNYHDVMRKRFLANLGSFKSNYPMNLNRIAICSGNIDGAELDQRNELINSGHLNGALVKLLAIKNKQWPSSDYEKNLSRSILGIRYEIYANGYRSDNLISRIKVGTMLNWYKFENYAFSDKVDFCPGGLNDANKSMTFGTSFNKQLGSVNWNVNLFNGTQLPFTCFIPTSSSSGLLKKDDYFYDFRNMNLEQPNNSIHAFDYIYSLNGNTRHVEISVAHIAFIEDHLKSVYSLPLTIPYVHDGVQQNEYRIRNWSTRILKAGIDIKSSGTLFINPFGTAAPSYGSQSGLFEVETRNCGSVINVNTGGKLVLGGVNGVAPSVLRIKDGSVLNLGNNSDFQINPGSKFIVEQGAVVYIYGTPNINLNGGTMELYGKLVLVDGAVFKPTGTGGVITIQNGADISCGSQSQFIVGSGYVLNNFTNITFPDRMALVQVSATTVNFNENIGWTILCPASINTATFDSYSGQKWTGLSFGSQTSNQLAFTKVTLRLAAIGLNLTNPNIKGILLNDVRFESCDVGLQTYGCGIEGSLRFTACTYGWYAEAQQNSSKVTISSTKTNNPIRYKAQAGGHLLLYGSYIEMGKNVFFDKTSTYYQNPAYITLSCCQFVSSPLSFEQVMPNLSTQFNDPAYNTSGGWNVFNDSKITLSNCADVLLKDGYNDFLDPNNQGVLQGTLQNPSFQKGYAVNFTRNAIDPAPLSYTPVDRSEADLYVNDWKLKVTLPVNTFGTANQTKNGGCWNNGNGQGKSKQVAEWNGEDLLVYPNPSSGRFTVKSSDMIRSVHISNMLGTSIPDRTNWNGIAKYFTVDLSDLPDGIYLLQVTDVLGQMHTSRLVVSH